MHHSQFNAFAHKIVCVRPMKTVLPILVHVSKSSCCFLSDFPSGPPGVGKTFTVEATAERFNLPLYSISAGELVVDHGDSNALEQQLDTIFKIAKHFKAVLLLDEADAFMEQRTSYHDTHNRLVTIFLRKLEYYQGILFLTTNRMIQFDEAIISRIHLTIKYEGLTREFRREIWKTQLTKARTVQGSAIVEDDVLKQLDNLSLNGREIKNLTSIAHALATVDGEPVSYKHLERAAESSEKLLEKFGQDSRVEGILEKLLGHSEMENAEL
ncbi:hypothetical protein N7491_000767 [Penicillium cf. griseofulvum]|uniref:AAA+ ATPase domain-containing protein n=1 Tax=Penicillium cf. griseofulvum TaxID=2972120 RepID=A0A9W9INV2_9EURO|nr:hypothetical protein N7472_011172 [Penicillium cf. griseofulvum]KAJ5451585.1 hypothetical protein N7491_000767 [Penicillium cf. griseofulvum]